MRIFSLMIAAVVVLSACETTEGLGRDVAALGAGIEQEAQDVQNGE
ncbi:entericidin [Phaeobacter sp. B1627]|nr:entericidin [Phaeobacter sp. B1627]TNJ47471.1 entericidin [Phaeobacter sp. B1627]